MHAEEEEKESSLSTGMHAEEKVVALDSQKALPNLRPELRYQATTTVDNNNKPKLLNSVSFPFFFTTFPTTTILESNKKCSSTHNSPCSLPQSENKLPTSFLSIPSFFFCLH
jgi:hypothetical protein